MLSINETDSYCRQVINSIRQQRTRGRCHPVNDTADVKIAEVITGIGRHIEVNSDADNAYDLAAEFAVTNGWGYWRVLNDYVREDSFDQDIYIRQIENPFSVYFDPNSAQPDGSDADKVLITDLITKAEFRRLYPDSTEQPFREGASGDARTQDWITKHDIRIAEYFRISRKAAKLVKLSDGTVLWENELPAPAVLAAVGVVVVGDRPSWKREVRWSKVSAFEELEHKVLPGRFIPVIPVYGVNILVDGKRRKFCMRALGFRGLLGGFRLRRCLVIRGCRDWRRRGDAQSRVHEFGAILARHQVRRLFWCLLLCCDFGHRFPYE